MSAPEEIVLPRSGVKLTPGKSGDEWWIEGDRRFYVDQVGPTFAVFAPGASWLPFDDFESAAAKLDEVVLSLRSALLAGTEERIARALYNDTGKDKAAPFDQIVPQFRESWRETARAVLSALTGGTDAAA